MDSEDVDAYLVVLQDDGTEVASDDDGGTDYNARVEFRAPTTGQYTILAASLFSETTGRYVIRLERASDGDGKVLLAATAVLTRTTGPRQWAGCTRWSTGFHDTTPNRKGQVRSSIGRA